MRSVSDFGEQLEDRSPRRPQPSPPGAPDLSNLPDSDNPFVIRGEEPPPRRAGDYLQEQAEESRAIRRAQDRGFVRGLLDMDALEERLEERFAALEAAAVELRALVTALTRKSAAKDRRRNKGGARG